MMTKMLLSFIHKQYEVIEPLSDTLQKMYQEYGDTGKLHT